jgi:predicted GIY-YIG superfamily endonuclease
MEQIYVLKCEKGKYYVGKTTDVMRRYKEHESGKGSAWTAKYKPLTMIECKPITSPHDENNVTKDYMKKFGIEHVRGGSYAQVILSSEVISVLQQEILGNADVCYKCKLAGHFASACPNVEQISPKTQKKKAVVEESDEWGANTATAHLRQNTAVLFTNVLVKRSMKRRTKKKNMKKITVLQRRRVSATNVVVLVIIHLTAMQRCILMVIPFKNKKLTLIPLNTSFSNAPPPT